MASGFTTSFGKRTLYLLNHDPVGSVKHIEEMGVGLSKFVILQTINEFRDAAYNDIIAGELYNTEAAAKARLRSDEYYLVLTVSAEAISHATPDGQVFIHKGYQPKVLALKTLINSYLYDEQTGFFKTGDKPAMSESGRRIYNYNPPKWPLFAALKEKTADTENLLPKNQ